jgi:glycosyltransferase involved in cell wall biosynthesis
MTLRRLRIVHSENSCGWGGQELRILGEAKGFLDRGHDVRLLCPREAPIYDAAVERSIPVEALPIKKRKFKALFAVRKWLQENRVDVVNTHSSTDSWLFSVAAKTISRRIPVLRTRHISAPVSHDPMTRWLYTHGANHVVTCGEKMRQTLIQDNGFPAARMTSIPTGIDTSHFVPGGRTTARQVLGLPANKTVIGIVATIRTWKGHQYLLEAIHELARDDVHLLIVGDGPMRDQVESQVKQLGMSDRVTMPGNQQDVAPWLRAMDLFALPSYGIEGVPQSIMQAMSCGLPVVSTTVGSIEEAVQDRTTGLIVPPKNSTALAAALRELLDNADLRQRFGSEGRKAAVARFGLDRMLDRMEEQFRRLVDGDPATFVQERRDDRYSDAA